MEMMLKTAGITAVTVVLYLVLNKQGKEFGTVLSLLVSFAIALTALNCLKPVLDFLMKLQQIGNLDSDFVRILLKAAGIGIVSQMAVLVCQDAGNSALARTVSMLAVALILLLSLPLFHNLLDMLQEILSKV